MKGQVDEKLTYLNYKEIGKKKKTRTNGIQKNCPKNNTKKHFWPPYSFSLYTCKKSDMAKEKKRECSKQLNQVRSHLYVIGQFCARDKVCDISNYAVHAFAYFTVVQEALLCWSDAKREPYKFWPS